MTGRPNANMCKDAGGYYKTGVGMILTCSKSWKILTKIRKGEDIIANFGENSGIESKFFINL